MKFMNTTKGWDCKNNRIISLDCIRVFAILCVILTHATENTYILNTEFLCNTERHIRWSGLAPNLFLSHHT